MLPEKVEAAILKLFNDKYTTEIGEISHSTTTRISHEVQRSWPWAMVAALPASSYSWSDSSTQPEESRPIRLVYIDGYPYT
ncbi:hypothetical protein J6590_040926 [Homalodisca vitripennis]|nr:hypothetical protein J6590_040926 [Homalodisca vitripennis]